MAATILVCDDDSAIRTVLNQALGRAGYDVRTTGTAAGLWRLISAGEGNLVITDVVLPDESGFDLIPRIKRMRPDLPIVVMSAQNTLLTAITAAERGAFEYLPKPFDLKELTNVVGRALVSPQSKREPGIEPAEERLPLIGRSPAMQEIYRVIARLTQTDLTVMIMGESGTGKELVARALHRESPRARKPFIALNTAAIPSELLESELFGHEAGAFTGAARRHVGRFEQADGGTLFLDEIGDMPLPLQTRLLRVLAENEFFRVGGRELIRVDVRVIAATHQNLSALVAEGRFRADLLHRLDVVRLQLPPLRARRDDIPRLAERFLRAAARKFDAPAKRFAPAALQRMLAHDWPGNVRELENLCWRLAALAPGDVIAAVDLDDVFDDGRIDAERIDEKHIDGKRIDDVRAACVGAAADASPSDWETALSAWARARLDAGSVDLNAEARALFDRALFDAALAHTGGHRSEAAAKLGLGRNTLTRKLGSGRKPRKPA